MTYLLDTSVLPETRKRQPAAGVVSWIGETSNRRPALSDGSGDVQAGFADRVLPVTLRIATASRSGEPPLRPGDAGPAYTVRGQGAAGEAR
jgi:hypothetical protein